MIIISRLIVIIALLGQTYSTGLDYNYDSLILDRHVVPRGARVNVRCDEHRVLATQNFLNRWYIFSVTLTRKTGCGWNKESILASSFRNLGAHWQPTVKDSSNWKVSFPGGGSKVQIDLLDATFDDSGYYECRVGFMHGKQKIEYTSRSEFLRVDWYQRVLDKEEITSGDNFTITCRLFTPRLPTYNYELMGLYLTFVSGSANCYDNKPLKIASVTRDLEFNNPNLWQNNALGWKMKTVVIGSVPRHNFCNFTLRVQVSNADVSRQAGYYTCAAAYYSPYRLQDQSAIYTRRLLRPKVKLTPIVSPPRPQMSDSVTLACGSDTMAPVVDIRRIFQVQLVHMPDCGGRQFHRYVYSGQNQVSLQSPRNYPWLLDYTNNNIHAESVNLQWKLQKLTAHDNGEYRCFIKYYCGLSGKNRTRMARATLSIEDSNSNFNNSIVRLVSNRKRKARTRDGDQSASGAGMSVLCGADRLLLPDDVSKILHLRITKRAPGQMSVTLVIRSFSNENWDKTNFPANRSWTLSSAKVKWRGIKTPQLEIAIPETTCDDVGNYTCHVVYACPTGDARVERSRTEQVVRKDILGCTEQMPFEEIVDPTSSTGQADRPWGCYLLLAWLTVCCSARTR